MLRRLIFAPLVLLPFFGCNCDETNVGKVGTQLEVPAVIDFGDVLIGQIEKRTLEIKNTGDANITVPRLQLAADFSGNDYQFLINTESFMLLAHSTKMLDVKFQPFAVTSSAVGSRFTILTDAVDNDGNAVQPVIEVRGRGVRDALSITPQPIDYGTVIIGGFEERDFTVTNLLSSPVDLILRPGTPDAIVNRSGNGKFEITSPIQPDGSLLGPGERLEAGASVTLHTRYTPHQMPLMEDDKARARIAACPDSICDQNLDFKGTPSLSGISCTPTTIEFGAINPNRYLERVVTCTNDANHPLRILGWSLSGGSAAEFTADVYAGIPSMLESHASFTVTTKFSPLIATLRLGVVHAELMVTAQTLEGANLRDVRIQMQGSAGGPGISVAPLELPFGQVAIGTSSMKRLLISNVGYASLVLTSVQTGDTGYTTNAQPIAIDVGEARTIEVYFTPTMERDYPSMLSVESNDAVTPVVNVALTGQGVSLPPCQYTITPSSLMWGIIQEEQSETKTIDITNVGTDACLISGLEIVPQGTDFHLSSMDTGMGFRLEAGLTKTVPVEFAPVLEGPQSADLTFYISDPANSNPLVHLFGLGLPPCGNAIVDIGEDCDDGNPFNGDLCDNNCTFPGCGNGEVDPGEGCDDGNSTPLDGCEPDCTRTGVCGNFNLEIGEECDDGNLMAYDGCDPLCFIEDCGNGTLDPGEQCDDGNRVNGDGCSQNCTLDTIPNVDVLTFGQGAMRGTGTGQIVVAGVTGPVTLAVLFWNGPTNANDFLANATVNFNGTYVSGVNVGFSSDNCWSFLNSQAYRADVTSLVTGDGTYTLSDFMKPGVDVNGVSLIVFYDDGDPTNNFDVMLFDSNDSNIASAFDPANWDQIWMVPNFTLGQSAFLELHVSDGQAFPDAAVLIDGVTVYDDPTGGGMLFSGDSVPNANPALVASAQGGLWDIHRVDITSVMTGGPQSLHMTAGQISDCLSLVASMILISQ